MPYLLCRLKQASQPKRRMMQNRRQQIFSAVRHEDGGGDSSLKKNAAMVNKLKQVTADNSAKLCDELRKLKFSKHAEEMLKSLSESATRVKSVSDAVAVVEVLSLLASSNLQNSC